MRPQLLFAYNADSGLFNTVTDIAHKILSPATYACNLCALTHGHFKVRQEWGRFLETLDAECEFMHRDEYYGKYDGPHDMALPAIFRIESGKPMLWIDADTLNHCVSLNELMTVVSERFQKA